MTEAFCLEHGRDHIKTDRGNIPYCAICEPATALTKQPDPPTLEQITERAIDAYGDIWIALKLWRGRMISDAGSIGQIDGLIAGALDAAYEAGRRDAHVSTQEGCGAFIKQIAELEAWKASAMAVMEPLQDIGKEFGLPLGRSIPAELAQLVREKMAEGDRLFTMHNEAVAALNDTLTEADGPRAEISRLRTKAPEPVKHVASPSIAARWNDGPGMQR